ncbi:DUF4181 domain-containing protein [Alteribacter natronophilus]|uniref:DUF4181 domain-containing protein n=1 Tax=Alteribacter natronophilus TaxID=2583810 RepID=UPI00110E1D8B|nr:DUF4181 domain-containing protein [Alteribacter natronophilus]TMW72824.1 DUF4181 domain-containing protein [Alteribacter natronophilus]
MFNYEYENTLHKRIDWILRGTFLTVTLGYGAYLLMLNPMEMPAFQLHHVAIGFGLLITAFQVFMEWKFAEERNRWILTLSELALLAVILIALYITDFFWLFQ